jgi:acyl-CoA synthetase (AMP-forming)/AMP-acid ligase II
VNGFQVAPAELEGCILAHKFVADVCVIGISDSFSGERPLAFVVLTADASNKIQKDPKAVAEIKTSIMEVSYSKNSISQTNSRDTSARSGAQVAVQTTSTGRACGDDSKKS